MSAEAADAQEQLLELEALQSIFGDQLALIEEVPFVRLEIFVPLHLGGPRHAFARIRLPPRTEEVVSEDEGLVANSSAQAERPDPRVSTERTGQKFIPAAIQVVENMLQKRDDAVTMPTLEEACIGGVMSSTSIIVEHVPPLRLTVEFCDGYPSSRPPHFTLAAQWLSNVQLAALCAELDSLANDGLGSPVVYMWADWLENNALVHLGLDGDQPLCLEASATNYDERAISELEDAMDVLEGLVIFDRDQRWWEWQQTAHTCNICFSEKPGTAFTKVGSCSHTFCTECVSEMMHVNISEGSVLQIRCPLPDCRAAVAPKVVLQLVSEADYNRWHRLQIQKLLSDLPGVAYCPRCEHNGFETPVLPAEEQSADDLPLAICDRPGCAFAFCAACREPYHPSRNCEAQIERLKKLGVSANATDVDRARRQRLADELQSLKMILAESVPCPKCKMPISRTQGCNHMVCGNCSTHFCYRCGADITETGYGHFRADKCPTFDREEVERMRDGFADGAGEDALQDELEELRRQYPEQANMVWNFRPQPGAWRRLARQRQPTDAQCPTCGQWNPRIGHNNHIRCRICKSNSCYACRKLIRGTVSLHFKGQGACPQHGG